MTVYLSACLLGGLRNYYWWSLMKKNEKIGLGPT